jgi:hypothetical protein
MKCSGPACACGPARGTRAWVYCRLPGPARRAALRGQPPGGGDDGGQRSEGEGNKQFRETAAGMHVTR